MAKEDTEAKESNIYCGFRYHSRSSVWCPTDGLCYLCSYFLYKKLNKCKIYFESTLPSLKDILREKIDKIIIDKYKKLLASWEGAKFVDRVAFSRLFQGLFDLTKISDNNPTLIEFITNYWQY